MAKDNHHTGPTGEVGTPRRHTRVSHTLGHTPPSVHTRHAGRNAHGKEQTRRPTRGGKCWGGTPGPKRHTNTTALSRSPPSQEYSKSTHIRSHNPNTPIDIMPLFLTRTSQNSTPTHIGWSARPTPKQSYHASQRNNITREGTHERGSSRSHTQHSERTIGWRTCKKYICIHIPTVMSQLYPTSIGVHLLDTNTTKTSGKNLIRQPNHTSHKTKARSYPNA